MTSRFTFVNKYIIIMTSHYEETHKVSKFVYTGMKRKFILNRSRHFLMKRVYLGTYEKHQFHRKKNFSLNESSSSHFLFFHATTKATLNRKRIYRNKLLMSNCFQFTGKKYLIVISDFSCEMFYHHSKPLRRRF